VLGFYLFTVRTLSARDPFIDLALFRDRNFVILVRRVPRGNKNPAGTLAKA